MPNPLVRTHVAVHAALISGWHRLRTDQRGEGVISAAIAVLIMAFLGASMWVLFDQVFSDANDRTKVEVEKIGR